MDNPHSQPNAPQSLFADDSLARAPAPQSAAPPAKRLSNVLLRIVLPAGLLLGGIALIAWLSQYLPSTGRNRPVDQPTTAATDPIRFEGARQRGGAIAAVFFFDDVADEKYIPEFELGVGGHYDFPFANTSAEPADLGIVEMNCSCSGVEICLFKNHEAEDYEKSRQDKAKLNALVGSLSWKALEHDKDLKHWVQVPANARGLLRIAWRGNKSEPEYQLLTAKVWSRPANSSRYPFINKLDVAVNYVRPVMFEDTRVDFGGFNPKDERTESFVCWSATSDIDVQPASADPRIKVVVDKLNAQDCAALQKRLRGDNLMTRVHCAFKVSVTLFEQRAGQQLDMGHFAKAVPMTITSNGQPVSAPLPILRANVRGPVLLGPQEEGGKIDFKNFKAKLGATKTVTLFADNGVKLEYSGCDPSWFAPAVELKVVKAEGSKTQWEMKVAVSADPDGRGFYLPEDSVLKLECELPAVGSAAPVTRTVRIPIVGTAGSH